MDDFKIRNQDTETPKTIKEEEEYFFLMNRLIGESIIKHQWGVRALKSLGSIGDKHKEKTILSRFLIYTLYSEAKTLEEAKQFLKNEITNTLKVEEDDIYHILFEIKYIWEYDYILGLLYIFIWERNDIANLEKRDRKKIYEEKRKWNREKKQAVKFCKDNNITLDEINKTSYNSKEETHLFYNYESTIKHIKNMAYFNLTEYSTTGKKRAKEIIKIFDYIS